MNKYKIMKTSIITKIYQKEKTINFYFKKGIKKEDIKFLLINNNSILLNIDNDIFRIRSFN